MTRKGTPVRSYLLTNRDLEVEIIEYGVRVRSLVVKNAPGGPRSVALGQNSLSEYEDDSMSMGAVVGRYANRIRDGQFTLGNSRIALSINEGHHHLHGGHIGFAHRCWRAEPMAQGARFEYFSPAGEEGYPGGVHARVEITLDENRLLYRYLASTDADTVFNPTNHMYFNLSGGATIADHELMLAADSYLPVDRGGIPTGEMKSVENTPFDFREGRRVGDQVLDHCYVLRSPSPSSSNACLSTDSIQLCVATTEPGIQLYTGDGLARPRSGMCLETQHYPDSPNRPSFPSTLLKRNGVFESVTEYRFEVTSPV